MNNGFNFWKRIISTSRSFPGGNKVHHLFIPRRSRPGDPREPRPASAAEVRDVNRKPLPCNIPRQIRILVHYWHLTNKDRLRLRKINIIFRCLRDWLKYAIIIFALEMFECLLLRRAASAWLLNACDLTDDQSSITKGGKVFRCGWISQMTDHHRGGSLITADDQGSSESGTKNRRIYYALPYTTRSCCTMCLNEL